MPIARPVTNQFVPPRMRVRALPDGPSGDPLAAGVGPGWPVSVGTRDGCMEDRAVGRAVLVASGGLAEVGVA
jgi:hypothetical protein